MNRGLFVGLLMIVIIVQSGALCWIGYQHYFSVESMWNRYLRGERMIMEGGVSGVREQTWRGVQMMDEAHRQLVAAGEIVTLDVPYGSKLEKVIEVDRIPDLVTGSQRMGGQRAVGKNGQRFQIDVRALRYLQEFLPQEFPGH